MWCPAKRMTSKGSGGDASPILKGVPGFVQFALLKSDGVGEYISHSTWADRESFFAWTQSEAFAAGHRQGSLAGVLEGPPQVSTYEAVIVENP
jgi:heme-degrading monooxygenase HmoA